MAHSKRLYFIGLVVVVLIFCSSIGLHLQAQEIIFQDKDLFEDRQKSPDSQEGIIVTECYRIGILGRGPVSRPFDFTLIWSPSRSGAIASFWASNALVSPLMLQMTMDGGYHLPSGSVCNISNGRSEECVDIHTCPLLLGMVANPDRHELLKQTKCGWNQSIPKVCCDMNWNCTTPDSEPGHCIKFTSCLHLQAMVKQSNISQEIIMYIRNLRCGSNSFDVCCTTLSSTLNIPLASKYNEKNEIKPTTTKTMQEYTTVNSMTTMPPELNTEFCGQEVSSNRIIGGDETAIDQYPWAAALEYDSGNDIEIKCGGTLISGTYVVTAAHCVFFTPPPINVRLGDYDIDHPGEDCVKVEGGGIDCTEGAVIIPIVKIISYPDYVPERRTHDIALMKLQNTAPYTDFIRPICLPTTDFTETATITVKLTVAGWGVSDEIRKYSPIKRHVAVPFVGRENCSDIYSRNNVTLGPGQICAGGVKGKDSCKGDSGGALMEMKEKLMEIAGVISFGFIPCGQENIPAVYTKVYHYLPWIRSIISGN